MRLRFLLVGILALAASTTAQTPTPTDLHLRGDRFKPLTARELTPEQKVLVEHLLTGERGTLNGPFNVLLRSPEMGDLAQKFGAYMRFHSSLPRRLNELAIILTARSWSSQFEWYAHRRYALEAGVSAGIVDAVAAGKRPSGMPPDEEAVYNFCQELLTTRNVSDATFQAAVAKLGER